MARVAGEGVPLLWITIVMLTLSWIFLSARLGVRKWKNNLGLDDWLMFAGLVCILAGLGRLWLTRDRCCIRSRQRWLLRAVSTEQVSIEMLLKQRML